MERLCCRKLRQPLTFSAGNLADDFSLHHQKPGPQSYIRPLLQNSRLELKETHTRRRLFFKKTLGKLRDNWGNKKNKDEREFQPLTPTATAIVSSLTPSQINIKPHIFKGLFTSILFTQYIMFCFLQKNYNEAKRQKTQPKETKCASKPDSDMKVILK